MNKHAWYTEEEHGLWVVMGLVVEIFFFFFFFIRYRVDFVWCGEGFNNPNWQLVLSGVLVVVLCCLCIFVNQNISFIAQIKSEPFNFQFQPLLCIYDLLSKKWSKNPFLLTAIIIK
jgi:hypothetical protein